ncbi:hypothetical protein ALC60_13299 [Trachymyrmex zeteki]|uniref:Uncharacterized protein n=1 Tax=Mycetomoellerius zeteki TaxID=64791 RepID=A0A151WI88_9HYME|nr:hypothetical protein ALC60_13299 [Trachymyrmex zeteki]
MVSEIGRPRSWPPRSPDLTSLDFCLWEITSLLFKRFYGGSPGVLKPAVVVIKKEPRRPRDRDATGIGCVLPKAGKRRDGARGSGANVPGPLSVSRLSISLSHSRTCIKLNFSQLIRFYATIPFRKIAREGSVQRGYQLSLDPISSRLKDESGTNVRYSRVHEGPFLGPNDTPPRLPVDVWCRSAQVAVLSKYSCWSLTCSSIETLLPSTGSCPGGCREVVRKYKMSWSSARPPR